MISLGNQFLKVSRKISTILRISPFLAAECNIDFYYAISPGLDITYSSPKEVSCLKRKLEQVAQLGCKAFALLFDDIEPEMCKQDKEVFQSFAHAQVSVTNEIFQVGNYLISRILGVHEIKMIFLILASWSTKISILSNPILHGQSCTHGTKFRISRHSWKQTSSRNQNNVDW